MTRLGGSLAYIDSRAQPGGFKTWVAYFHDRLAHSRNKPHQEVMLLVRYFSFYQHRGYILSMAEEPIKCPTCNTPLPRATVRAVIQAMARAGGRVTGHP